MNKLNFYQITMPIVTWRQTVSQLSVEEDAVGDAVDDASDLEDGSDLNYGSNYSSDSSFSGSELDSELENANLSTRLAEARERQQSTARPVSYLYGKPVRKGDKYKWRIKKPTRVSDRVNADLTPVIIPDPINDAAHAETLEEF